MGNDRRLSALDCEAAELWPAAARAPSAGGYRGPAPLRLLVLGQSHIQALGDAARQAPGHFAAYAGRPVEFAFLFLPDSGAVLSTGRADDGARPFVRDWLGEPGRFREDAARLVGAADHVAVLWFGGQLSTHMTFAVGPAFDIALPDEPAEAAAAGAPLIPCAAVEELMGAVVEQDHRFRLAAAVLAGPAAAGRVSFLAPPPPLPVAAVRDRLTTEPFFTGHAEALDLDLAAAPLVPDRVRVKVWKLLVSAYAALAERHGGRLIPPPAEAADAAGLLAPKYWGDDVTHANAAYGRLYLETILTRLAGGRT